jgi:C-terminal processing protease CtpA/Prc
MGLVVTSPGGRGAAEQAGIRVGDLIERINWVRVGAVREAAAALRDANNAISVTLSRHGHYAIVQLLLRPRPNRREPTEEGAVR